MTAASFRFSSLSSMPVMHKSPARKMSPERPEWARMVSTGPEEGGFVMVMPVRMFVMFVIHRLFTTRAAAQAAP